MQRKFAEKLLQCFENYSSLFAEAQMDMIEHIIYHVLEECSSKGKPKQKIKNSKIIVFPKRGVHHEK